jgi:peptidylprolyl isomerase
MESAKKGDRVKINVLGKLQNGNTIFSSEKKGSVELKIGESSLIKGLEEAVIGMKPGDTKKTKIPPEKAFGPHNDDLKIQISKDKFPSRINPEPNMFLEMRQPNGQTKTVKIESVSNEMVTIDTNHPFAGEEITLDIELIEVNP